MVGGDALEPEEGSILHPHQFGAYKVSSAQRGSSQGGVYGFSQHARMGMSQHPLSAFGTSHPADVALGRTRRLRGYAAALNTGSSMVPHMRQDRAQQVQEENHIG